MTPRYSRHLRLFTVAAGLCLTLCASSLQAHEPGRKSGKNSIVVPPATPQTPRVEAPGTEGSWSTLPYLMPINPIHVSLLRTGKVLIVSGSENERGDYDAGEFYAGVLDPTAGTILVQNIPWDVFCTGMAALPDGRFVIIGGTKSYSPFQGLSITTVFDPLTEKFAQLEDMTHGRWYGSSIILSDGSLMAYSGHNEEHVINQSVQTYRAGIGWSAEFPSPIKPSLYPRMHLLPTGDVFVSGAQPTSSTYHPDTHTWDEAAAQTILPQNRKGGASVLLPLRPEADYEAKVMILGGVTPSTKTCEIIDFADANPAWHSTASMTFPRIRLNAVLLPTGKVLALGGSFIDEDASTASLGAEIFDPATETWTSAGTAVYPRLYHSSALLLPDATVWVAGSNPKDVWEEHMEIYTPAYLYNSDGTLATRPTISSVPPEVGYGANLQIRTPDSANIRDVVLVRPGSSTHSFDFEQRVIGMSFTAVSGQLKAVTPPNGSIAPPGYYMVFIINQAGVPSVAKFVHLTANPTNRPPNGTISAPTGDITIDPGQSVNFEGTASDPNGTIASYKWVFPGGDPATSTAQSPGTVHFDSSGTFIVSMTPLDNAGENDPSPPTRTITVKTEPLEVAITAPPANSEVSGRKVVITVTVDGEDDDEISNTFTVKVDSTEIGTRTLPEEEANFTWKTDGFAPGVHTITATVRDYEGNEGTVNEQVTLVR